MDALKQITDGEQSRVVARSWLVHAAQEPDNNMFVVHCIQIQMKAIYLFTFAIFS